MEYSPESNNYLVMSRFIVNLKKKEESYEAECSQLQHRISLISEEYIESLKKKIGKKEKKLEKLTSLNEELNRPKVTEQIEPNYLNEMQGLADLKNFYVEKNKEISKVLEKNSELKRSVCLKYADLMELYKGLRLEVFEINKSTPKYKKCEVLVKNLKLSQRESVRSLSRLEVKQNLLRNQFFKVKKEEKSLGSLLGEVRKILSPVKKEVKNIRSLSQARLPSVLNSSKSNVSRVYY